MNNRRKKKKRKQALILMLSVIVVLIIAASVIFLVYYNNLRILSKEWKDKIYPGITINGIDLTGKNFGEAEEILNTQCTEKLLDKELKIVVQDKEFEYKYSDISAGYDIDKAIEEAIDYGKDLSIFKQKSLIKNKDNKKKEFELDFTYDEEKFAQLEETIKSQVNIEPQNAILHFNWGSFSITPEVVGYELNTEGINEKIKEAISGDLNKESIINLEMIEKEPEITETQLSKITGQMSYYETSFNKGYDTGRDYNLSVAAAQVNGTLLMPGDVFSYAEKTRAVENKYKDAMIIGEGNQYVPGNAGGICQVSTTLYNAAMRANLRSIERHNHSIASEYVPVGLDATVSWGYLDYRFANTYDFPIYIYAAVVGNMVQIAIYGDPSAMRGKTYSMTSEVEVKEAENKQIAKSYLITYENGQEINREYIDTSTYILDNTPANEKNEQEKNADLAQPSTSENKVETSTTN
ncbi:MAG: VanW family protein [Clostridium sp.]|nr:VanW family protein [Clostridium sp.]